MLDRYARLLDRLTDGFRVVPLREFAEAPRDRPIVGLRHDVDVRLGSALEMAEVERSRGLRATYFILHTAPYYGRSVLPRLRLLQEMGHEVGWHNDLVTLQCVLGGDPREYLRRELDWLRGSGIDVRGTASHGSYWAHRLGYHNNYFFSDFDDELHDGFPHNEVVEAGSRRCVLAKGSLEEFGFEYEAYHLGEDRYFSDARFDAAGRRFHPDSVDLDGLGPGGSAIVLTHPESWDPSVGRKAIRTALWAPRRLLLGERSWRLP